MREYFQHHPIGFGAIVFCVLAVFATIRAIFLALLAVNSPCVPKDPGDPCDGPAMLFVSLLVMSPIIGLISGTISGLIGWYYMRLGESFKQEIISIR